MCDSKLGTYLHYNFTMESCYIGQEYIKNEFDLITKTISKLDDHIHRCKIQLTAVKLKVSALQLQMVAMKAIYQDIMELRKIIVILNPHLKKAR